MLDFDRQVTMSGFERYLTKRVIAANGKSRLTFAQEIN